MKKLLLISSIVSSALILSSCGDERKKTAFNSEAVDPVTSEEIAENTAVAPIILEPYAASSSAVVDEDSNYKDSDVDILNLSDLNNESTDNDYSTNTHGLITQETLADWIDGWSTDDTNKPTGITGNLIILQQGVGPDGAKYIKPNSDKGVFTYVESGWLTTRSDGVVRSTSFVPDGSTIDALLAKYAIDPEKDMIVCAQGAGGPSIYMSQGRCWYTLTYWGVKQENIAVLNGNNAYLKKERKIVLSNAASPQPEPKLIKSVAELPNGSAIHATLDDVIKVAKGEDGSALLWDARSLGQYSAGKYNWKDGEVIESDYSIDSFQNNAARQSHPNNAVNLEFTNFIDVANGLYHDKDKIEAIILQNQAEHTSNNQRFVDSSYQPLSSGLDPSKTIIHYCETSMRAAITIVATSVILGMESRLFDGAMLEWNSLTAGTQDKYGKQVLPEDSPWNTEHFSQPEQVYGSDERIGGSSDYVAPRSLEGWAVQLTAEKQAAADEAAKEQGNTGNAPSTGGGFAPPANACGG